MNVFKFAEANGHYITAIPYKNRWVIIEEGWDDTVVQYLYIPGYSKRIAMKATDKGIRYIYGSKRLYMRHCSFRYVPSWCTMGCTL